MNRYKTLVDVLQAQQEVNDRGITIIRAQSDETFISYRSLYQNALKRLGALQAQGLIPGDEVILQIADVEEFITSLWAGLLGGFTLVPLAIPHRPAEENYRNQRDIYKRLGNPYLLSDIDFNPGGQEITKRTILINQVKNHGQSGRIPGRKPTDIAVVQYSSGSTGSPKGVVLTHENILANIDAIISGIAGDVSDRCLSWMPLTHDMGLIGFHLVPLAGGANHFLMPVSLFARRPLLWLEKASQHKITVLGSPDFGLKLFLSALKPDKNYHWDLSPVRLIFNGAEPINESVCTTFVQKLKKYRLRETVIFPVYGLAEATLAVTFPPLNEHLKTVTVSRNQLAVGNRVEPIPEHPEPNDHIVRFVDVGSPVANCRVKIVDAGFNDVEENTVGHILIKGKNVTASYYKVNNEAGETRQEQTNFTADGWYDTGDLGFLRKGRLVVTGREKDMVVVNGQNYWLYDLERLAEQVDGIAPRKITICGITDPVSGEQKICVFLVYKKDLNGLIPLWKRLSTFFYQRIGISIKYVIPVDYLPFTTSGKRMRHVLVEKYRNGEFAETLAALLKCRASGRITPPVSSETASTKEIEAQLATIVSSLVNLEPGEIGREDNLSEYGVDSLKLPLLVSELEKIYPGMVQLIDCFDHPTISELAGLIAQRKNNSGSTFISPKMRFHDRENEQNQDNNNTRRSLQVDLPADTLGTLAEIAKKENVSGDIVLLGLYIDLFSQVYRRNTITLQTRWEKDKWISLYLDLSGIEYFTDLLTLVAGCLKEGKNRLEETHFPVFYRQYSNEPIDKEIQRHDLVLIVKGEPANLSFLFDFNERRFPKMKIQHLGRLYVQLIQTLAVKYL